MLKIIHRYLFSVVLLCLIFTISNGQETRIVLEDNQTTYTNFTVGYIIEKHGENAGIKQITTQNFTEKTSNAFSFGYKKNNFWFHFTAYNNSENSKNMILELTEIIHKQVDMYVIEDPIIHKENGLRIPVQQREIQESTPSFKLHFLPYETKDIYIHLSSIYGVFGAIHLKNEEQYKKDIQQKKYIYLFYMTVIITIALYNLILFFYLKEKVYLFYIAHITVFLIWAANYKGVLLPYISMEVYDWLQITIPIFFALLILFSQYILETKKYFPRLNKVLIGFLFVSLISLIFMVISIELGFLFVNIIAVPLLPFLLFVAFWSIYHNHKIAKIYLLGLSVYIIGMSLLSLLALGLLPYSILLSTSAMIGSFLEVIFFSFLLAYRINTVRQESLQTKIALDTQQKTESSRLFHSVAEKTMALNRAKKELENELRKKVELEKHLKHLASTDSMTNLLNRRAFFDICDKELIRACSNGYPLACLIVDIDHFKTINDTYGHDAGDKVIIDISKVMVDNIRSMDYLGRIGGEEFAILMPETAMDAAFQIADRLRVNISKYEIIIDTKIVHITVSIGLSYLTHEDKNIHTLIKRADTALYEAKENGRNQVCTI